MLPLGASRGILAIATLSTDSTVNSESLRPALDFAGVDFGERGVHTVYPSRVLPRDPRQPDPLPLRNYNGRVGGGSMVSLQTDLVIAGGNAVRRNPGVADALAVDQQRSPGARCDVQEARGLGKQGHADDRGDSRQDLHREAGGQVSRRRG